MPVHRRELLAGAAACSELPGPYPRLLARHAEDPAPLVRLLAAVGIAGSFAKIYFQYRNSMAELDQSAPWVGHARTEQFRAQAKARADRLSAPLEADR